MERADKEEAEELQHRFQTGRVRRMAQATSIPGLAKELGIRPKLGRCPHAVTKAAYSYGYQIDR
jgi:hypothetical protein